MSLGDKLYELRKKQGLTQEEAAEKLGITRQTVSKWETDQSTPDFDKLLPISRLYGISLDELAGNERREEPVRQENVYIPVRFHYEYKSKRTLFGLPLVHIHLGRGFCRAKGILAIGNIATGIFAMGLFSIGVLSFGALAIGVLAFGGLAAGGVAIGGVAAGILAFGGAAFGVMAIGGAAFGVYSIGGCAIASRVALGGYAWGEIAIGKMVRGPIAFLTDQSFAGVAPEVVRRTILTRFPDTWKFVADLFGFLVSP